MTIGTRLEELLDQERRVLLNGDLSKLKKLADTKVGISEELLENPLKIPREQLQRIAEKSNDNEALLHAAQRGIKAAITHVREAAEGSFQSYSKEGQRTPLSRSNKVQQKI